MERKLLLTGCAGFIGINFLMQITKDFIDSYDYILSIDKMGYATKYNAELYAELCRDYKIIMMHQNINDLPSGMLDTDEWDIVNFASESHVDNSIKNPYQSFSENSNITCKIVSLFSSIKQIRNFYHISTDEVYGDLPLHAKEEDWFVPSSQFRPSNPYSASKLAQDAFLMSMRRTFGLNVHIIRMANQFGQFQHPEKMIPASCLRAFNGETIKVYGQGLNKRQWTPVEITAKIIVDKVGKQEQFNTLHIANKHGLLNNNEIAEILRDTIGFCTGKKPEIEYIEDRKGHDMMYALKTTADVDSYFEDAKIDQLISQTAEFYYMNREDFK